MIWIWCAGAATLLLFIFYWAVFMNKPNPEDSETVPFETLLSEVAAFYRQVSIAANPSFRHGVGVSVLRFSPVKENRSVLGAEQEAEPKAADEAQEDHVAEEKESDSSDD